MTKPRIIKRYENRKLYDTEQKRYVRLEEVAQLVHEGEPLVVQDNATGEDVTAQTLAKVIAEGAAPSGATPPAAVLQEWIRRGAGSVALGLDQIQGGIDWVLRKSLGGRAPLRDLQRELELLREQVRKLEAAIAELETETEQEAKDDSDGGRRGGRSAAG